MLHLAQRNLFQSPTRLAIASGGVALALTLILALDAIVLGAERQITAYMDHSGADIFVAQSGVSTMHMTASWIPASVVADVRQVEGVAEASPVLYLGAMMAVGQERAAVYLIGLPSDARLGIPWRVVAGSPIPAQGEVVIDQSIAGQAGVGIGDQITILGQTLTIRGLSRGTVNLTNSIAFISAADFATIRNNAQTVSYVLVKARPGADPAALAQAIEARIPGVTASTLATFTAQERRVVKDMSTDIVTIMNSVGVVIGLAVMALTVYTATLARRAEYGVLKALGARNRQLYRVVLAQAMLSVVLGLALALLITAGLVLVVPRLNPSLTLALSAAALLKVASVALIISGLAAILPIRQIAGLDPAVVFRGGKQ
jgi:putative ABC transport system permease protein